MKKLTLTFALYFILVQFIACGIFESEPSLNCSETFTVTDESIRINLSCPSGTATGVFERSNITYDFLSRVISFNFRIDCTGDDITGRIFNIKYDLGGRIKSFEAEVNGEKCSWP